jgi:hypothetical protein
MSVQELETAIQKLSPSDLQAFSKWFEEFIADQWDRQLEADIENGKLDKIGKDVDQRFEAGLCKPL